MRVTRVWSLENYRKRTAVRTMAQNVVQTMHHVTAKPTVQKTVRERSSVLWSHSLSCFNGIPVASPAAHTKSLVTDADERGILDWHASERLPRVKWSAATKSPIIWDFHPSRACINEFTRGERGDALEISTGLWANSLWLHRLPPGKLIDACRPRLFPRLPWVLSSKQALRVDFVPKD